MLLMAPKAEAELQAPTEPSELMAAGHSTLATIPEGKILTTVEDRHALTRSSNPFENSVEDKLQDTQEPDSARYRGLELAQAPVRQSTPYSLTNLGIRETTAGPLNHKHQESQIGLQTHDHQHQQAIVHIPVASRAVAKYGVANSRSPMVASGHLRGPQAPVPATYLHQQRNPPHNQLVVSRATVPIPGNADGQWTGTPIPAALRGEMTVLDRERERDHILESSRYSGAIDAARRVLAPFHYQQLMPFQQSLMQLPHQPATQSQVMTVPLPQQQALTIPQTWSTPATHMDQILAGSGQLLGGLFGPGTGGLLAGSGSFSTSHTSIRITFDPRAGTAFGSQQSNVFQRDANGQIRMESDRRDFTRH